MRNVLFVAPFPLETTLRFARAAARLSGVRLLGIGQELVRGESRAAFADQVQVADGLDTRQLIEAARLLERRHGRLHRVLGILEPLQVQLGELRRALGVPGTDPATADLFRDKARMKDELRRHGLPCARHRLIRSWADAEAFVAEVGFPVVLKPPAGMGCTATWRVRGADELRAALSAIHASPERPALAEELLRGQEHSFETITVGGVPQAWSVANYQPGCLEVLENPWIQWACVLPREVDAPACQRAREMGFAAIAALGLEDGMTHMEWFEQADGRLAIGEIAARPPGAQLLHMTGVVHDIDIYRAWARAVVHGVLDAPWRRKYAAGCAYVRGMGSGRVAAVTGVRETHEAVGQWLVEAKLPTLGAAKNDSYEGDGYVMVRHESTAKVQAMIKTIVETLKIHYAREG